MIFFNNNAELENAMTTPSAELVQMMKNIDGDFLILGAAGKMGITLAKLAKRAIGEAGVKKRVVCVSRFSDKSVVAQLEACGIETIAADLLEPGAMDDIPRLKNIIYMVGMKFGATGQEAKTWAVNTYLPGMVCEKFKNARIVLFSTGNVYPYTKKETGGSIETDAPQPIGEYAQSALGRERIFQYFAARYKIPGLIFRLNYAVECRYGILLDVAQKVFEGKKVDLSTGYVNVIWQGDANEIALRSLAIVQNPPVLLNVTGQEIVSIRELAQRFGEFFKREPLFINEETETALLSNSALSRQLLGASKVTLEEMVGWVAAWVRDGHSTLDKPTKYEVRSGAY